MLLDMGNIDARCIFCVKVGMFIHLEQSKICYLTVNKLGILMLTIQHDLIISVCFI